MDSQLFLLGLAYGALLLCLGFVCGLRLGRRGAEPPETVEAEHVREWVGNLTQWTSTVHEDVASYREEMAGLAEQAEGIRGRQESPRSAVVLELLSQILSVNQRLQTRLSDAESRLNRQSEELQEYLSEARTDGLTNLPNRRALDEDLKRRMAEWRRYRAPFSLALLDIDSFKRINDRYGHPMGDQVLHKVAATLRATMRDADLVARFGGEEFAVIMPATTEEASHRAVERARTAVESVLLVVDGEELRPTISCGVAQAQDNDDIASLLQRADAALYTSKYAGRNQCHWHDGCRCVPIEKINAAVETPENACVPA